MNYPPNLLKIVTHANICSAFFYQSALLFFPLIICTYQTGQIDLQVSTDITHYYSDSDSSGTLIRSD